MPHIEHKLKNPINFGGGHTSFMTTRGQTENRVNTLSEGRKLILGMLLPHIKKKNPRKQEAGLCKPCKHSISRRVLKFEGYHISGLWVLHIIDH